LRLAARKPPDAIILDLGLPDVPGIDVIIGLRVWTSLPIIVLSGRTDTTEKIAALDAGADDYLTKPFELPELQARLRALIRRGAGQATTVVVIGDVTVNTAERTVRKAGQVVALTPTEYALVELLALHRGKLVTRTMIYEHLFDEESDTLSNLVDVHVANVRKKLGKDFITTRRGEGYQVHV
jgi:two-component system OmpR family response regulator